MGSSGSERRPLVGITAYCERATYTVWDQDTVLLPRAYSDAMLAAGGLPVLLPPHPEGAAAVDRLDAVVLAGGPDIGPSHYGAAPDPRTGVPRIERDAAELAVLERALAAGIPVLGVCRGMQVLNVGLGGTLAQHLPDTLGHTGHNPQPGMFGSIEVTLQPGSLVHRALGAAMTVSCHHHQGIGRLGDGLVVTGRAADGAVEAVELAGHEFVLGVQWHPEQDLARDEVRLFAALVAAATADRSTQRERV